MTVADQSAPETKLALDLSLSVRISPQVANRLCAAAPKSVTPRNETAGLLFGLPEERLVHVQAFKFFPENVWKASKAPLGTLHSMLSASRTDPEVSGLDWVGWYSVRASGTLNQSDFEFHNAHFRRPTDLALILRPENSHLVWFEIFSRTPNAPLNTITSRRGLVSLSRVILTTEPVEIALRTDTKPVSPPAAEPPIQSLIHKVIEAPPRPIETQVATRAQPEPPSGSQRIPVAAPPILRRVQAPEPSAASAIPVPTPEPLDTTARAKKGRFPLISSAIALTFLGAAALALLMYGLPAGNQTLSFLRSLLPSAGLKLQAQGEPNGIRLSWNRMNTVVRSAKGATLLVDDGPHHRSWHLGPSEVANGSVLYKPATDDVTFRLTVSGEPGQLITESTRALDGANRHPLPPIASKPIPDISPASEIVSRPKLPDLKSDSQTKPPSTLTDHPAPRVSQTAKPIQTESNSLPLPTRESSAQLVIPSLKIEVPPAPSLPIVLQDVKIRQLPDSTVMNAQDLTLPRPAPPALKIGHIESPITAPNLSHAKPAVAIPTPSTAPPIYVPPQPLRQVSPDLRHFSPGIVESAHDIEIEVKLDKTGRVTAAQIASKGPIANSALREAALAAARRWTFRPATLRGVSVESDHTIVFRFHSADR